MVTSYISPKYPELPPGSIKAIYSAVEVRLLHLDLGSSDSVRKAAQEVTTYPEDINVLVNYAAVMAVPYALTEDGFETHLQTNLSPLLFNNLIIEKILINRSSGPISSLPRVVNVTSEDYRIREVRYFDHNLHDGASYDTRSAYGASKTMTLLHASELARCLGDKDLVEISLNSGVIITNLSHHVGAMYMFADLWALHRKLGNSIGWSTPQPLNPNHGVANNAYAALAPIFKALISVKPSDSSSGYILSLEKLPESVENMVSRAAGELEGNKCWELSEKLLG
ncbi:Small ribosomal subunit biogenesis [Apiospora arundinis]